MTNQHNENTDDRTIWDVTPLKTQIELSEGNVRMRESCVYQGRVRVAAAMQTSVGEPECAWMYVQAESRDGADVTLTTDQARDLRDALDECIRRVEDAEE